jgi:hypothetical protein
MREKGPSTFDVTHSFTPSLIEFLPLDRIGFLRRLGKPVTTGWQFLNITTVTSGPPSPFSPEFSRPELELAVRIALTC